MFRVDDQEDKRRFAKSLTLFSPTFLKCLFVPMKPEKNESVMTLEDNPKSQLSE